MSTYSKHWKIDGVTAAFITRGAENGRYQILFERENATLEQIESINWAKPTIERLTDRDCELGLPEGYGFEIVDITYTNSTRSYTVTVKTARQYLGDVTEYQAQIAEFQTAAAEKDSTISQQAAELEEKDAALAEKEATITQQAGALAEKEAAIEALEAAGTAEQVASELSAAYEEGVESNG